MRQQAYENLLQLMEQAMARGDTNALRNLIAKGSILRKRENDASVLRELLNR